METFSPVAQRVYDETVKILGRHSTEKLLKQLSKQDLASMTKIAIKEILEQRQVEIPSTFTTQVEKDFESKILSTPKVKETEKEKERDNHISDEVRKDIKNRVRTGESIYSIRKSLNLSWSTVNSIAHE